MEEGQRVKVTLFYREGQPMYDYGYIVERDGKQFVDFDDYKAYNKEWQATAHLVPVENFLAVEAVEEVVEKAE